MFDVIWTDPNRELVGERRARKETTTGRDDRDPKSNHHRGRTSISTRSSSSSSSEKPFSTFFGSSKSYRKPLAPSTKSQSTAAAVTNGGTTAAASVLQSPTTSNRSRRSSLYGVSSMLSAADTAQLKANSAAADGGFLPEQQFAESESVLSKWTERSITTPGSTSGASATESLSKSHVIQTLGPSSFITKETEVTVGIRDPDIDIDQMVTEVHISSDAVRPERPVTPTRDLSPAAAPVRAELPAAPVLREAAPGVREAVPLVVPRKENLAPEVRVAPPVAAPNWSQRFKPLAAEGWKPPEAWDVSPVSEVPPPTIAKQVAVTVTEMEDDAYSMSMDLNSMQREVKRMAAASPSIILVRLKEEWGEADDATLYKELEMERKRWMLSALHNMDRNFETEVTRPSPSKALMSRPPKVLALHETQASASFLAAVHHGVPVHHVSPTPLPHTLFPNIHPIISPGKPSSKISVAPQLFTQVYSMPLPSLLPSPEIPQLLRSVHRCLAPQGVLHLTLIDPSPAASSLGPLMRAWLDEHLLFNLERNFRCMNPSKLFPIWLADACLRGDGSTITTVKFYAITPTPGSAADADRSRTLDAGLSASPEKPFVAHTADPQKRASGVKSAASGTNSGASTRSARSASSASGTRDAVRTELRSVVGRMLWKEVWGSYVAADKWWWENPACVEECNRLGTYWEYNLIEAVKELP